jgi:DNA-binding CsgD family transcriptional regulator
MDGPLDLSELPPPLRRALELAAAEPDLVRLRAEGVRPDHLRRAERLGLLRLRNGRAEPTAEATAAVVDELRRRLAAATAALRAEPRLPVVRGGRHGFDLATYEELVTEAAGLESLAPAVAARLYAQAAVFAAQSDVASSRHAAGRSLALASECAPAELPAARIAVATAALAGGDAAPAEELVRSGLDDPGDDPRGAIRGLYGLGALCYYLEDYAAARRVLERALGLARPIGARREVAVLLDTLAAVEVRLGRYASAHGKSAEALRLARAEGDDTQAASCLTTLAGVDAVQGRERQARARVEEALALVPGDHLVRAWGLTALALLELGLGRVERAVELAPRLDDVFAAVGGQAANEVRWLPILVESCVRLGRDDEAARASERLAASAAGFGAGWEAVAARCRALVARGAHAEALFERALDLHRASPRPFERAWTELCYGEWLRRARRRREARPQLESALATFERLHAAPWVERARRELAGATAGRRRTSPRDLLTSHERQVVALVTAGARNREAAAALFVTPKTIERHLTNVYAKLGIRSRTELARLFL